MEMTRDLSVAELFYHLSYPICVEIIIVSFHDCQTLLYEIQKTWLFTKKTVIIEISKNEISKK